MTNLRDKVFEALDNARENGYNFEGMDYNAIASDIATYCADLEDADVDQIAQYVKEWQDK